MLNLPQIDEIVSRAAATTLKKTGISRVFSSPTTDSYGDDALNVTIVLKNGTTEQISGDDVIDTYARIGDDLSKNGEDRFPIIWFVTEAELAEIDDPES
jgi:hypothetical protein